MSDAPRAGARPARLHGMNATEAARSETESGRKTHGRPAQSARRAKGEHDLRRPQRADVWIAACTLATALLLLAALPLLAGPMAADLGTDPEIVALIGPDAARRLSGASPGTVPELGGLGWWLLCIVVIVQSATIACARIRPRVAMIVVAVVPVVAATTAGTAFSIAAIAVGVGAFLTGLRMRGPRMWLTAVGMAFATFALTTVSLSGGALNPTFGGTAAQEMSARGMAAPGAAGVVAVAGPIAVAQAVTVVGAPLLVGLIVAGRRETRAARAERATALRREDAAVARERSAVGREHQALVDAAVARERTAMARDLHDIAAHHMSGIALTAAALERQAGGTSPAARDTARESAALIRAQSTAVLGDLRRLVGLLRDDSASSAAANALDSIADLVAERRRAGEAVVLRVPARPDGDAPSADVSGPNVAPRRPDGDAPGAAAAPKESERTTGFGLSPLAQLVGYRMVQESLANAALHAPGAACSVTIDNHVESDAVVITVRNDPPDPGSTDPGAVPDGHDGDPAGTGPSDGGFGLIGMRERAALVGAALSYGPTDAGGWEVRLELPREPGRQPAGTSPTTFDDRSDGDADKETTDREGTA